MSAPSTRWSRAEFAASDLWRGARWGDALVRNVQRASGAVLAAMAVASPPGGSGSSILACHPKQLASAAGRIWAGAMALLQERGRAGAGRVFAASPCALTGGAQPSGADPRVAVEIASLVAGMLGAEQEPFGWILIGSSAQPATALASLRVPLESVSRLATATIQTALDLARHLGVAFPERRDRGDLTSREWEVAQLVAEGLSDLNVAARLQLSERTVGVHLHHVYRKLSVHSRAELARVLGAAAMPTS
jgi:DNA-binding CsgD family transcriptional regulator